MQLLTREELLKVSLRMVDAMVAAEESPHMRVRGNLLRFYLADVARGRKDGRIQMNPDCQAQIASRK